MDARFEKEDIVQSLIVIEELYNQAGFSDKVKFGMLRKAAMDHTRLTEFLLFEGPGNYQSLNNAILEYMGNCGANISNFFFHDSRSALSLSAVKATLDDVKEVEAQLDIKLEMLSEQFKNFPSTLNQKMQDVERPPVFFSYCQKEEHYFSQCRENHMRTARCGYCHKMGHSTDRCFQK